MAIIDVCLFNDEFELWDIHYNVLKDRIDQFIVCEAEMTFSGKPKKLLFPKDKYPDVTYHVIDDWGDEALWDMAIASPNTNGADHWKREFYIKEKIKEALIHLKDDDAVFIGDVDEIIDPETAQIEPWFPVKLKLRVYTYYLNNRSTEAFWGTLMAKYGDIKDSCLNHMRQGAKKSDGYGGCHFTSMGGAFSLAKKLTDSYTHESYATSQVLDNLAYNIEQGKDFLGRDFAYTQDESEWPKYLKDNRAKYKHLIK